jgi:hypothetical protein
MKWLLLAALLLPTAAFAQAPSEGSTRMRSGRDPNQIICKRQREIGSRLVIRRDCLTRAQWDEIRRQTRHNVDRAQLTRVIPGGG